MKTYRFCRISVASELRFPELAEIEGEADIRLSAAATAPEWVERVEPFQQWHLEDGSTWCVFREHRDEYYLTFGEYATFWLAGREVYFLSPAGVSEDTVRHLFLNQVMPVVLGLRGVTTLHASAVAVDGRVAVFAGESGRGKSTLALSFAGAGHSFLSDDLVYVDEQMRVIPSYPSLRIFEDSLTAAGEGGVRLSPSAEYNAKVRVLGGGGVPYQEEPLPLGAIFFLEEGPQVEWEPITGAAAMIALVGASFLVEFRRSAQLRSHFAYMTNLAERAPAFRLRVPRDFGQLAAVRSVVGEVLRRV